MFKNDTALPRCIAIDKHWNKCRVSLGSLVALVIRLPISWKVSTAFSFHDPDDSIAVGAKMCVELMSAYFVHFRSAARFAAAPAITEVSFRCKSSNLSGTVTSQVNALPRDHGMSVVSSGCFPFVLDKPYDCLKTVIWARLIDLQIMTFSSATVAVEHCCVCMVVRVWHLPLFHMGKCEAHTFGVPIWSLRQSVSFRRGASIRSTL